MLRTVQISVFSPKTSQKFQILNYHTELRLPETKIYFYRVKKSISFDFVEFSAIDFKGRNAEEALANLSKMFVSKVWVVQLNSEGNKGSNSN